MHRCAGRRGGGTPRPGCTTARLCFLRPSAECELTENVSSGRSFPRISCLPLRAAPRAAMENPEGDAQRDAPATPLVVLTLEAESRPIPLPMVTFALPATSKQESEKPKKPVNRQERKVRSPQARRVAQCVPSSRQAIPAASATRAT